MTKKFAYRIPIIYRVFFIVLFGAFMLGEHGFFPVEWPNGDIVEPFFTIAFIVAITVLIFSPYRNSFIELRATQLLLPSLFCPPFNKRTIEYSGILSIAESRDKHGYGKLILKTKSGKVKISSHFCYDKTIITYGSPDEYHDLYYALRDRVSY